MPSPRLTFGGPVTERDRNWKYADDSVREPLAIERARNHGLELGADPVSPAVASQLTVLAAARRARNIIELGTGAGVSGLALLSASTESHLTSIDPESEFQASARHSFTEAGVAASRVRFITGRAGDVLPRMNDASYDVVFIDADPEGVLEYVEHGLRLASPGGVIAVARALVGVADPTVRDDAAVSLRALIAELSASTAVVSALSPAGDGLLQIVKLGD